MLYGLSNISGFILLDKNLHSSQTIGHCSSKHTSVKTNITAPIVSIKIIEAELQFGAKIRPPKEMNELTDSTEHNYSTNLVALIQTVNPFSWATCPENCQTLGKMILVTPKQEVKLKSECFCGVNFFPLIYKKNSFLSSVIVHLLQLLWFILIFLIFWIEFF